MATCDVCGYELVVFDSGEFGDDLRYTHSLDMPYELRDHEPEVYIPDGNDDET